MTTEQVLKFIEENPQFNINEAGFQRKNVNGKFTEELSLAIYIDKKKPLSEIPANQVIPTGVYIDGFGFVKTDILEGETVIQACSDCATTGNRFGWDAPVDSKIRPHRDIRRPLQGGVSISSIPSGTSAHENASYVGTLGFIAVDALDGSLVAVTNHHVAAFDQTVGGGAAGTYAHQRITGSSRFTTTTDVYNFYGHRIEQSQKDDFSNEMVMRLGDQYNPYYLYEDGRYQNALAVGYLKRYMPLTTGNNSIDCAIVGLNQQTSAEIISVLGSNGVTASVNIGRQVLGAASWQILGHDLMGSQRYYPFATTEEINSMTGIAFRNEATASTPNIVMAGRTTGLKGQPQNSNSSVTDSSCVLEMLNANLVVNNVVLKRTTCNFTNCLSYSWKTCSNIESSLGGDSGSAILGRFNGIWKIVGIHFAANSVTKQGRGIRIDHIAPLLKIRPYMGEPINNPSRPPRARRLAFRNKQSNPFFTHTDGRTYYQMGTINHQSDDDILSPIPMPVSMEPPNTTVMFLEQGAQPAEPGAGFANFIGKGAYKHETPWAAPECLSKIKVWYHGSYPFYFVEFNNAKYIRVVAMAWGENGCGPGSMAAGFWAEKYAIYSRGDSLPPNYNIIDNSNWFNIVTGDTYFFQYKTDYIAASVSQPNENGRGYVNFSMNPFPVLGNFVCPVSKQMLACYHNETGDEVFPWGDFVDSDENQNFVRFAVGKYEGGEQFFTLKFKGKEFPTQNFCGIDPDKDCLPPPPDDDNYYNGSAGVGLGGDLV